MHPLCCRRSLEEKQVQFLIKFWDTWCGTISIPKVLQHISSDTSHFPEGPSKDVTDTPLLFPVLQLYSLKRPTAIRVSVEPFQQPEWALHRVLWWLDLLTRQSKLSLTAVSELSQGFGAAFHWQLHCDLRFCLMEMSNRPHTHL